MIESEFASANTSGTPEGYSAAEVATAASALEAQGDSDGARILLERAVQGGATEPGIWHNLGIARAAMDDFQGAIDAYTVAIKGGYSSQVNRGYCYEQLGSWENAREDYVAALERSSVDVDALVDLGTLELSLENYEDAKKWLMRAAALDPRANWQLADVYLAHDDSESAVTALYSAIGAGEDRAYLDLALIEADTAPRAVVEEHFRRAIIAGASSARREFAVFLDLAGDVDGAIAVATDGIEHGDTTCFAPLAVIYESLGEFDRAIEYYKRAIEYGDNEYETDLAELETRKE